MPSEGPYRVGQEVEVTYRARVVEVGTGSDAGDTHSQCIRLENERGKTGWIVPSHEAITVTVVSEPLPTEPGIYRMADPTAARDYVGPYHTGGYRFHYLNSDGNWADIGWGSPGRSDGMNLEGPLVLPAELGDPLSSGEKGKRA